jgi:hypothetical protein
MESEEELARRAEQAADAEDMAGPGLAGEPNAPPDHAPSGEDSSLTPAEAVEAELRRAEDLSPPPAEAQPGLPATLPEVGDSAAGAETPPPPEPEPDEPRATVEHPLGEDRACPAAPRLWPRRDATPGHPAGAWRGAGPGRARHRERPGAGSRRRRRGT